MQMKLYTSHRTMEAKEDIIKKINGNIRIEEISNVEIYFHIFKTFRER